MFGRWKKKLFVPQAQKRQLLLYGLQRSGTNYLESLVTLNYPGCIFLNGDDRNNITHKHFRLYDDKQCIPEPQFANNLTFRSFADFEKALPQTPDLYLVISKDPYSWLTSYYKWSEKNNWPPHQYHYIEEYNLFYGKWMAFAKESGNILFIRYADLLQNPTHEVNRIGRSLGLNELSTIKTTKKVYASRKFSDSKRNEFLNNEHLKKIPAEELEIINQRLDSELMSFLNYPIADRNGLI